MHRAMDDVLAGFKGSSVFRYSRSRPESTGACLWRWIAALAQRRGSASWGANVSTAGGSFGRKLRILIITGAFYPKIDGSVIAAGNLVDDLTKKGHQVTVLTRRYGRQEEADSWNGVPVERVSQRGFSIASRLLMVVDQVRRGSQLIKEGRFDAIHAHGFSSLLVAEVLRIFSKIPVVVTFHGLQRLWSRDWSLKWFVMFASLLPVEGALARRADLVVAQSARLKTVLMGLYKVDPSAIMVVPNPVDVSTFRFHPSEDRSKVVLFVGTIGTIYGPDLLVKASVEVLRHEPEAKFVFVGAGPAENYTGELAKSLGVDGSTQFVGRLTDRKRLEEYYARSRVLVIPFQGRGGYILSLAALEAMAVGRPVIIAYDFDETEGVIRTTNDPNRIAEKILEVLSLSDEEYARLSQVARSSMERLGGADVADRLEGIYLDLVSPRNLTRDRRDVLAPEAM